jgi:hypothetical protein
LPAGLYAVLKQCRVCAVKFITFSTTVKGWGGLTGGNRVSAVVKCGFWNVVRGA